jgi:catechol 2,3-dioxygenase-like lactoylglutathione lyase family enzyme
MKMLKQLTHAQVWVHDQDEALAFYTDKLGMELREDVTVPELGNFRWLSVGVPGQPDGPSRSWQSRARRSSKKRRASRSTR